MANIKFAENVRNQIDDAVKKGAKPLIDTKQVFPNDKVRIFHFLTTFFFYVSNQV